MDIKKCKEKFKDPIYKGKECEAAAKWLVKLNDYGEYSHPVCGTHSKKVKEKDKIPIEEKKKNSNKLIKRRNINQENNKIMKKMK